MTSQQRAKLICKKYNEDVCEIRSLLTRIHTNSLYQSIIKKERMRPLGKAIGEIESAIDKMHRFYRTLPNTDVRDFIPDKESSIDEQLEHMIYLDNKYMAELCELIGVSLEGKAYSVKAKCIKCRHSDPR